MGLFLRRPPPGGVGSASAAFCPFGAVGLPQAATARVRSRRHGEDPVERPVVLRQAGTGNGPTGTVGSATVVRGEGPGWGPTEWTRIAAGSGHESTSHTRAHPLGLTGTAATGFGNSSRRRRCLFHLREQFLRPSPRQCLLTGHGSVGPAQQEGPLLRRRAVPRPSQDSASRRGNVNRALRQRRNSPLSRAAPVWTTGAPMDLSPGPTPGSGIDGRPAGCGWTAVEPAWTHPRPRRRRRAERRSAAPRSP